MSTETRPTGLVTFLFTDVEGSTQLWSRDPDAMSRALEAHDRALSAAFENHAGYVFSKAGDGFAVAFFSPRDAVLAAIDGQRAVAAAGPASTPLRVRMALHAGTAEERGGDYYGPPLNRCARLLEVTNGGQVVCSGVVASMLEPDLPDGVTLVDIGEHRLRDLPGTEHIFDISHPDLGEPNHRLRGSAGRHNLPVALTAFIGRVEETARVLDLLGTNKLLTLTGVGGVGKTRLAIEATRQVLGGYSGEVWYVDLTPIGDPSGVSEVIAKTLSVLERPPDPITETVLEHLERRATLLLLDNVEHVVDGVAKFVDLALARVPHLQILATSREALSVPGETVYVVSPLDSGDGAADGGPTDAEALFIDRARAVDPGFDPGPPGAVARICEKLDHLPLAIELAAAWVRVLSPEQIADRLDDRFRLLTGGGRLASPHHQTLLATMDWSYDQLAPAEQVLLRRLSVFCGGFTLEAATEVCGFDGIEPEDVLPLLARLVETSLVDPVSESRYRLLETVREYGSRRKAESEEPGLLERRHAEFFLRSGPPGPDGVPEPGVRLEWFAYRDHEYDNFRAALSWAMASGELGLATGLAIELGNYWLNSGCCLGEGDRWLQSLVERLDRSPSPQRQRILTFAAIHASASGRYAEAEELATEVEGMAIALGDRAGLASALTIRGSVAQVIGHLDDAAGFAEAAVEISRELDDPRTPDKLLHVVMVLTLMGRYDEAASWLEEHAALVEDLGEDEGGLLQILWRGVLDYHRGDLEQAEAELRGALRSMPPVVRSGVAFARLHLAKVALARGNSERAIAVSRVVRELGSQLGDRLVEMEALILAAEASVGLGDLQEASHALDEAQGMIGRSEAGQLAGRLAGVRGASEAQRDRRAAVRWLGTSQVLYSTMGAERARPEQMRFDESVAALRGELGEASFNRLWTEATAIDREGALALVGVTGY
jgi:predicted ATPase/class 3 adenylate cyclase